MYSLDEFDRHQDHPSLTLFAMDATLNRSPSPTIQFPLNLNCSHHDKDSPPPSDDKWMVIDEMDFFAEKSHDNEAFSTDKKVLDCPTSLEFNVNVTYVVDPYKFNFSIIFFYHIISNNFSVSYIYIYIYRLA